MWLGTLAGVSSVLQGSSACRVRWTPRHIERSDNSSLEKTCAHCTYILSLCLCQVSSHSHHKAHNSTEAHEAHQQSRLGKPRASPPPERLPETPELSPTPEERPSTSEPEQAPDLSGKACCNHGVGIHTDHEEVSLGIRVCR